MFSYTLTDVENSTLGRRWYQSIDSCTSMKNPQISAIMLYVLLGYRSIAYSKIFDRMPFGLFLSLFYAAHKIYYKAFESIKLLIANDVLTVIN